MLKLSKKDKITIASFSMALSVIFLLFGIVGAFWIDMWLATTQWVLLSVLAAAWGIYLKLEMRV